MIFSERLKLSRRAEIWCRQNKVVESPFGIVCALNAMDALRQPEEDSEEQKQRKRATK